MVPRGVPAINQRKRLAGNDAPDARKERAAGRGRAALTRWRAGRASGASPGRRAGASLRSSGMEAVRLFDHCPRCTAASSPRAEARRDEPFTCGRCGFVLYLNPAGAVAALITRSDGGMVFIRRAKEPARGRLAMPGGFVDPGESAEEALRREVREEIGIEIHDLQYLCSHPNRYPYKAVTYDTLDLFFVARAHEPDRAAALDQVEDVLWTDPFAVPPDELAFDSMRAALVLFRERFQRPLEG